MDVDKTSEPDVSVFGEVEEHNDKKFQALLSSKEMLEYCIQQERLQSESLTWDIKNLEGSNEVSRDKNELERQDLDELTHENEGLKEQIEALEGQLGQADLSVTLAGIELSEDTRNSSRRASADSSENITPELEHKLNGLQQMSSNLRNEIARIEKETLHLESQISNMEPIEMDGLDVLLELAMAKKL